MSTTQQTLLCNYLQENYPSAASNVNSDRNILYLNLYRIFLEEGWSLLSSRDDGKCLLYIILQSLDIIIENSLEDFIAEQFIKYFRLYPRELTKYIPHSKDYSKHIFNRTDNKETIMSKLLELFDDNNLSEAFIEILSKSMNINILLLTKDTKSNFLLLILSRINLKIQDI